MAKGCGRGVDGGDVNEDSWPDTISGEGYGIFSDCGLVCGAGVIEFWEAELISR